MMEEKLDAEGERAALALLSEAGMAIRDERLKQIMAEIAEWSERRWAREDAPNLVVYSILELAYSYPKRGHDLIESMHTLLQSDRVVPAVILARALVETTAMGRYFIETMEKRLSSADYPRLEKEFLRFYMGSRMGESQIKSVHINDALRELEEIDLAYLSYLVGKYPSLWASSGPDRVQTFKDNASLLKTYDRLSEISHPNGLGTQYLYPAADAPDNTKVVEHYRFMTGPAIWQSHHLLTALDRLNDFADRFVAAFPDQTRFSEELPQSTGTPATP